MKLIGIIFTTILIFGIIPIQYIPVSFTIPILIPQAFANNSTFSYSINMTANDWPSGGKNPVILVDPTANKDPTSRERLNVYDPTVNSIPTMRFGTPFTLSGGSAAFYKTGSWNVVINNTGGLQSSLTQVHIATDKASDEATSGRPVYAVGVLPVTISNNGGIIVDMKTTMQTLKQTIHNTATGNPEKFKGFNFLNLDLRSFGIAGYTTGGSITKVNIYLIHTANGPILDSNGIMASDVKRISVANTNSLHDFINLNLTSSKVPNPSQLNTDIFTIPDTDKIGLVFEFKTTGNVVLGANKEFPIVADFFSIGLTGFGKTNDQRINNAIYRFELLETGHNTNTFSGTNSYVMLNQLNIFDPNTYSTLRTINEEVKFIATQDMRQLESNVPEITYFIQTANKTLSAQQEIQTHTGTIKFDKNKYNVGDTVGVTLWDADLNVDNDLIDIYTVVAPSNNLATHPQDVAVDTIGMTGLGTNSDGSPFGSLLEIVFGKNDIRWSNAIIPGDANHTGSCTFAAGQVNSNTGTSQGYATSLSATGFSLVETAPTTGIFTGTFVFPDELCQSGSIVSTTGLDIKAKYFDFSDRSGRFAEKEDNVGGFGFVDTLKIVPEFATFTTINQVVPSPSPTETVPVVIFYRNTTAAEAGIQELRNLGLTPAKTIDIVPSVSLNVTGSQLNNISNKFAVAIFRDEPVYSSGAVTDNQINANQVWPTGVTGNHATIAILDSGLDMSQVPTEFGNSVTCYDTFNMNNCDDEIGHGTHVAGIALAQGNPDSSLKGVAPGANLQVIKVIKPGINGLTAGTDSNIGTGIDWAINNGANVINLSLESPGFTSPPNNPSCDLDAGTRSSVGAIYPYVYAAVSRGVPVVAASGNHWNVASPACISKVIAVGAVDGNSPSILFTDSVTGLSSATGAAMADHGLVAPGVGVKSTWPTSLVTQGWNVMSGTSMAAPAVSGTIALILDKYVQVAGSSAVPLTSEVITQILFDKAQAYGIAHIGATLDHTKYGIGLLDAYGAVNAVSPASLQLHYRQTQTTNTASSSTSVVSQPITIHASVSDIATGIHTQPTGRIVFFDESRSYYLFTNPQNCVGNGNQLSCDITYTPNSAGPHTITAVYLGDTYHDMSSANTTVQVTTISTGTNTNVTVEPTTGSVRQGNTDVITATITSDPIGTPVTSGSVTFDPAAQFGPSSCHQSSNEMICSATYTAPQTSGPVTITATYSDGGTFHQGNGQTTITVTDCMIATAAFGSALAPQVDALRNFRDHDILQTKDGSSFMNVFNAWYYSFSPYVADFERSQPWFQLMVRTSIYPLLDILTAADKAYIMAPGEYGSLSAGLVASSLIGALYFWPFAFISPQIRNNKKYNYKFVIGIFSVILIATICSITIGNQAIMMGTTAIFIISSTAIFATLSAKGLLSIYNKIINHRRNDIENTIYLE